MSNIQDPGTCGKLSYNYNYRVCPEKLLQFQEDGLTILDDIISEADLLEIERIYDEYMREGSPEKQGKDFCDMSKPFNTPRSEYSVINAMLPRVYYPQLQGNAYERVAANIAKQLFPDVEMVLDYDQLLDKVTLFCLSTSPFFSILLHIADLHFVCVLFFEDAYKERCSVRLASRYGLLAQPQHDTRHTNCHCK